jgi:uncharacterized protein (DUF488 family)
LYYIIYTYIGGTILIYTSYFSSHKYHPEDGVSISRWNSFWKCATFSALAPSEQLLTWWKSLPKAAQELPEAQEHYKRIYTEQTLSRISQAEVAYILDGKVLLCYEKTGDFCHRHIVADWLRNAGFECEEL